MHMNFGGLHMNNTLETIQARVISQQRGLYKVIIGTQIYNTVLPGKYRYDIVSDMDYPVVGDNVLVSHIDDSQVLLHAILPRNTYVKRQAAGLEHRVQGIVANVDTLFITIAVNADFNVRRIERYLAVAWDSGAKPVILLTKTDLVDTLEPYLLAVEEVAFDVPILSTTQQDTSTYDAITAYMGADQTIAFIGSSGVGKSTLINHFLPDTHKQKTKELRDDDQGKHTTTARELFLLADGTAVIDTPGMRELGVFSTDISRGFQDIEALAMECKFTNCQHDTEPDCAVQQAIADGTLDSSRYKNYLKLQREVAYTQNKSKEIHEAIIKKQFGSRKNMRSVLKEKRNQRGRR